MSVSINGTTGLINANISGTIQAGSIVTGNLFGNVTGNLTGTATTALTALTASNVVEGSIVAADLNGGQTGNAPIYGCRAWVNFDGTGTVGNNQTIRAQGNVSRVFKNEQGSYTIVFTIPMPDNNYCISGQTNEVSEGNRSSGFCIRGNSTTFMSTLSFRIDSGSKSTGGAYDHSVINLLVFR